MYLLFLSSPCKSPPRLISNSHTLYLKLLSIHKYAGSHVWGFETLHTTLIWYTEPTSSPTSSLHPSCRNPPKPSSSLPHHHVLLQPNCLPRPQLHNLRTPYQNQLCSLANPSPLPDHGGGAIWVYRSNNPRAFQNHSHKNLRWERSYRSQSCLQPLASPRSTNSGLTLKPLQRSADSGCLPRHSTRHMVCSRKHVRCII